MSPKFLVGTVGSDLLVKSDDGCRDLVDEAKNYLLLPQDRPLMQGPRTRPRKPIRCGEVLFAGEKSKDFNLFSFGILGSLHIFPFNKNICIHEVKTSASELENK